MAVFERSIEVSSPVEVVFDFLANPANLIAVSPPELNMQLVEGPPRLQLGSRITVRGRRWGISQTVVSEVTAFEPNSLIVDEQREGPFARWVHAHRVSGRDGKTAIVDRIEFQAPSGLAGFVLTEKRIAADLVWVFAYRTGRMHELLGK